MMLLNIIKMPIFPKFAETFNTVPREQQRAKKHLIKVIINLSDNMQVREIWRKNSKERNLPCQR